MPTPLRDGVPDLSYIEDAAGAAGASACSRARSVVLESTTYPGTTEELVAPDPREGGPAAPGRDFHLGFSPERIDPGNPTLDFETTPKVVSGIDAESLEAVHAFYDGVVDTPCRCPAEGGRAGQAAGEHLPAREHRAGQRARRCSPTTSTSTSGRRSTPPPPSRSGSCSSRPGPVSAGTACRSTRATSRGRCAGARPAVPVRRAGQRHQRAHARLRRRAGAPTLLNRSGGSRSTARLRAGVGVAYKQGPATSGEFRRPNADRAADRATGATSTVATRTCPTWDTHADVDLEACPSTVADFDLIIVVTDHEEFDFDKIADRARPGPGLPEPRGPSPQRPQPLRRVRSWQVMEASQARGSPPQSSATRSAALGSSSSSPSRWLSSALLCYAPHGVPGRQ